MGHVNSGQIFDEMGVEQWPNMAREPREPGLPVSLEERSAALDGVRGLALFGVLLVNDVTLFRTSLFAQFVPAVASADAGSLDQALSWFIVYFLEFKAFGIFSLLFGVGLAAQEERARRSGRAFMPYALRRLSFLLALGLVHLFLIWNGDILTLYALMGLLAAPFLRLPTRWLALLAALSFVLHLAPIPLPEPFPSVDALRSHVARAMHVYPNGSFASVLAFRVKEVRPIAALLVWAAPRTLGLMFTGACAWRLRLFTKDVRGGAAAGVAVALTATGLGLTYVNRLHALHGLADSVAGNASSILLSLGYTGVLLLLHASRMGARIIALVAPIGRTALSSYLTQSVVLGWIFYGYGLGLFGRTSVATATGIAAAIYLAQILVARVWLSRFGFGPVEWLWRSVTYGKIVRIRV
jgi:uncharacterized protein